MTWLLPSKNRIGNLRRMCRGFREYGVSTPGIIIVNQDEFDARKHEYATLDLPSNWVVVAAQAGCMQDAIRCVWPMVKDAPWIGLLQDDLTPGTPGWDEHLVRKVNGWNVVSAFDGRSNRMHGAIVWSGDLLRAMGWDAPYPTGLKHLYGDDVWETLGRETGCWVLDQSVITPHHNETYTANADDTARSIAAHTDHDKSRYEGWLANDKPECVRKIRELKASKGARELSFSVSGMSILVATPSVSNRPEETYNQSITDTINRLAQMGVACARSVEKYNADVSLARSNLFSVFLRSPFTHMLMIDDDMDWDFSAVLRLIGAKKDFVAVAGPKKSYPPRFAANHTDEAENVIPLRLEAETGTCEVTEVGAAFCLLSKQAAQKLAQSYPELHYETAGGEVNVAAFLGMVHRRRYKAEDFAFCRRLRAIGIKSYICPDVPLGHTGAHRFYGDLWSAATSQSRIAAPPAIAQAAE